MGTVVLSSITALYITTLLSNMDTEEECVLVVHIVEMVELSFVTALYTKILLILMEEDCTFI